MLIYMATTSASALTQCRVHITIRVFGEHSKPHFFLDEREPHDAAAVSPVNVCQTHFLALWKIDYSKHIL